MEKCTGPSNLFEAFSKLLWAEFSEGPQDSYPVQCFPFSGGRAWRCDGRSPPCTAPLTRQSLRGFADVIEVLIDGLWVTQKGHRPSWAEPYQVTCSRSQEAMKGDSPAGLQGASTVSTRDWRRRILPTILWDQKRTPAIRWNCSPADTLWDSEERAKLSHARDSWPTEMSEWGSGFQV